MFWKSRWTGDWFLRRAADQPNRAGIQDNQILTSAFDEALSQTSSFSCSMIGECPVCSLSSSPSPSSSTQFNPGVSYINVNVKQTILTPGAGYRIVDQDKLKVDARVGFLDKT